jgi:ADP-heptose:LPS heptosyltransferase
MHITELMGKMIEVDIDNRQIQVCITQKEDEKAISFLSKYKNPILIQTASRNYSSKSWIFGRWEELVSRMPQYTFLQIGEKNEPVVKGVVNLLGKTTLRESLALLKHVKSFVAIDSFINNASNAFLTRGVVLFGASTPQIWGYPNNINIYKRVICSPCIDLLWGYPCPYQLECMQKITVDEVHEALEEQLGYKKWR